jgi:hypothetical protein
VSTPIRATQNPPFHKVLSGFNGTMRPGFCSGFMSDNHSSPVVLVVDDEPLIRLNATGALNDAGCRTYEAGEAEEAMNIIARHPEISVLFTDINMPGQDDGLALAGKVHLARPDIQLIITSGRERPQASAIPDEGRFVAKPYDMDVISDLVMTHVRKPEADQG